MTTCPETLRAMREAFYSKADVQTTGTILNLDEALAAAIAVAPVKPLTVKPMEFFSPPGFHGTKFAKTILGEYAVWPGYFRRPNEVAGTPSDDPEAAAQADFAERILCVLFAPPAGGDVEPVAWTSSKEFERLKSKRVSDLYSLSPSNGPSRHLKGYDIPLYTAPPAADKAALEEENKRLRAALKKIADERGVCGKCGKDAEGAGEGLVHCDDGGCWWHNRDYQATARAALAQKGGET